ncbi:MAG: tetratricopeptide repeat protein [Magnetospirillum sp.]|nr:tetratricopeptide repeat protein [Magnetospirillum sp.]
MASKVKSALRGWTAVAALMAAMAGCTPHEDTAAKLPLDGSAIAGRSALGAFLAGRYAQASGDTQAAAEFYLQALDHDAENGELAARAFTLLVVEGRLEEAMPLADRLLAFDADAPVPLLVSGIREARDGRWAEAEKRFDALPKRGVNTFLAPLLTAWARVGGGRPDAALEALAPLSKTSGLSTLHAFHAGLINDLSDRREAAEQAYQTVLAAQVSVSTIEAAGAFYVRTGRPDKARELVARYLADHPETMLVDPGMGTTTAAGVRPVGSAKAGMAQALFDTASLLRQGNAFEYAMMFTRLTLALQPDFPIAQLTAGDVLSAQDRRAEANVLYRSIAAASPIHAFARLKVAINLDEMGEIDGALADLDALARQRPEAVDALVTTGDVLRRHKRFAEAAGAYEQALARVPKLEAPHWLLLYSRGICYERAKRWSQAEADFLKALQLKPDQPDVLNYLGYTWVDKGVRLEEGRGMLEKAAGLRPNDGAIVDSLGWALYRLGAFQDAVKALERAIELKPEDPTINDHLGDAYWQVGRLAEARFQWTRAMGLDPEPEQVEPLKEKVRTGELIAKPVVK